MLDVDLVLLVPGEGGDQVQPRHAGEILPEEEVRLLVPAPEVEQRLPGPELRRVSQEGSEGGHPCARAHLSVSLFTVTYNMMGTDAADAHHDHGHRGRGEGQRAPPRPHRNQAPGLQLRDPGGAQPSPGHP